MIPVEQSVSGITITSTVSQQLAGNYNIYPVQTQVPTISSNSLFSFDDPDPLIYNSNNPYPGFFYEILDIGYSKGYHIITIKFFPLEYLPLSGTLKLYSEINFTINYSTSSNLDYLLPNRQTTYSNNIAISYIESIVENRNDLSFVSGGAKQIIDIGTPSSNIKGMNPTQLNFIPDYVIITKNEFIDAFNILAEWKKQKGVYALIVDVEDIYENYTGYDNAEKIRNYLKDVYVNWGTSYILLGGDTDIIPARETKIHYPDYESDFYYATVEGNWNSNGDNLFGYLPNEDYFKDFDVGRVPANTIDEVERFVEKVLKYEKLPNTSDLGYINNMSFWVGNDIGNSPFDRLNQMTNSVSGLLDPNEYKVLKLYEPSKISPYEIVIDETAYFNRCQVSQGCL